MTEPNAARLRVLVADPQPMLLSVLAYPLHAVADVTMYSGDADGIEAAAIDAAAQVLILGPAMPIGGLTATIPRLVARGTRTLVVSSQPLNQESSALLLAGASGFLRDHDTSPDELVDAVRRVATGASALHPDVVHAVLTEWRQQRVGDVAQPEAVTARELDVLLGLRDGLTTRLIATRLEVAEKTVEAHKSRLFAKLGARNQAQAVQIGSERGLF